VDLSRPVFDAPRLAGAGDVRAGHYFVQMMATL
jgi:hypothetical protein